MLRKIKRAVDELPCDGEKPDVGIIISDIENCIYKLEELKVCGKSCLDILLGCILALEVLIEKEGENNG